MTLAAVLGIVVSFAAVSNGWQGPAVVLWQEEPKPTAQQPSPGQSGPQEPPAQAQPVPETTPPPPETSAPATETPAPAGVQNTPDKPQTAKPKASSSKARKAHKRAAKPPANPNEPKKVVVSNGSTAEPVIQISSGNSNSQDANSTNSLLDATGSNLKKISGRQLSSAQQDMAKQIRAYMEQSRAASGMGDEQGAHNLAFKAHLLSEELLKQ